MSLVTTATSWCGDSVRHSAATRAVLPDPTGPPTPTRSGWSRSKETHLPTSVFLGAQLEGRRRPRGPPRQEPLQVRGFGRSVPVWRGDLQTWRGLVGDSVGERSEIGHD